MFDEKQIKILNDELNSSRIKTRTKGNINLSYLEGFDIIETANIVFGFGNWEYTISTLEQVSQETNTNQNLVVCYKAIVKIVIYNTTHTNLISREDVGFGTGIAKTLADAHENGAKEAITDCIKRTLRTFGNQFGNSLYDKTKNHNTSPQVKNYSQNQNISNTNKTTRNEQTNVNTQQSHQSFNQFEYSSLYNIGLNILEQNGYLLITGDDIFSKKDSIKACGFRWDGKTKQWYKQIEQAA
ncbi:MAG: DNA repair protein Rad52 [Arcobacter sp.]|nr:DNA repair protein Rad52 [Arcobacter sp.]|tara:strand:- start:18502 stop:19224 length:723 start_codon:yes stop_codon:yes gene_type:complete